MSGNHIRRLLPILASMLLFLSLLSGCQSNRGKAAPLEGSASLFDPQHFSVTKLSTLGDRWQNSPKTNSPLLFVGNFMSRKGEQIALVDGGQVRFYSGRGDLLKSAVLPSADFGSGLVADVSESGKDDLVLGGRQSSSAHLTAVDGDGHLLFDDSFQSMVQGNTRPAFYRDGKIYFTACPQFSISPKSVGAFDVSKQVVDWSKKVVQVPLGLSLGSGGLIAVSNRAVSRDAGGVLVDPSTGGNRQAVLVYDLSGKRREYDPFGAASEEGYFIKGQIASVSEKLADLTTNGNPSVLELIRRPSSIYEGNAEFRIVSLAGEVEHHLQGPPRTGGNFGFYSNGRDSKIVIVWNSAGKLLVTDSRLKVLHELTLPGSIHDARLLQLGRFDGSGAVEYLVADSNRLYVLDEALQVIFSTAFATTVHRAAFFRTSHGKAGLAVLAGRLHLFGVAPKEPSATLEVYTDPPGAVVAIDGTPIPRSHLPILRNLTLGSHYIVAKIGKQVGRENVSLKPGKLTEVTLHVDGVGGSAVALQDSEVSTTIRPPSVPIRSYADLRLISHAAVPSGYRLVAAADFVGDANEELLLADTGHLHFRLYNTDLDQIGDHAYSGGTARFNIVRNLTGNGKADIVVQSANSADTLLAYDGDGRLVMDKFFSNGFDTQTFFEGWIGNKLVARIVTGYLLSPRGFYLYDPKTERIDSFSPVAGFISWIRVFNNKLYIEYYTPDNGAKVVHPDGSVETDSKIYLDVFTKNGRWLPESQPLKTPNPMGNIFIFPFDAKRNGKPELYFIVQKDPHYNKGRPGIYRFDGSAPPKPVLFGPMDSYSIAYSLESEKGTDLAVYWRSAKTLQLFGKDFATLYTHTFTAPISLAFTNLNGDSQWERIQPAGDKAIIETLSGTPIRSLVLPGDTVEQVITADLYRNGKKEIILKGKKSIAIYGY